MASDRLRVFISYARKDGAAFAEDLLAGLEAAGFDAFLDREDIAAGEDWQERLRALLQQADTVVYVVTPGSVTSDRCAWEIDRAEELSKRLVPVVAAEVAEAEVPARLRRLNYVFFTRQGFGPALRELSTSLRTDLQWVREHTRLGDLAARWEAKGRAEALLLRGSELEAAQRWLQTAVTGLAPTEAHRAFVAESERAEHLRTSDERKRLEELAKAQEERALALHRAARANWLLTGVISLVLLGGAATLLQRRARLEEEFRSRLHEVTSTEQSLKFDDQVLRSQLDAVTRNLERVTDEVPRVDVKDPAQVDGRRGEDEPAAEEPALRWTVDLFWCDGDEARKAKAERLAAVLRSDSSQLGFAVDEVNVRPLSAAVNARPDYNVRVDEVRPEVDEVTQADGLVAFAASQGVTLQRGHADSRTPYYLSVFFCDGAAGARKSY